MFREYFSKATITLFLLTAITACGGGGGSDGSNNNGGGTPQPTNSAPTANAGADQSVEEQANVTLSGSGTDSDGSISSYSWTQTAGTSVTLTNADSATASFTAPDVTADETLTFQLTVTDNDGATATDTVDIVIQNINQPPTANAGTDQTVEEQVNVTLSGSGTDSDGSISSYSWIQTAGTSVTLINADSATASFTAPDVSADETLTFQLTVTDNDSATATDTVEITVANVELNISATSTGNGVISPESRTINKGESAFFTLTAAIGYEIDKVSGCSGSLKGNIFTTDALSDSCSLNVSFIAKSTPKESDALGSQRTLVALINFPDNNEKTISLQTMMNLVRDNSNSLNHFLIDNSNGKAWVDAEFLDWTTLSKDSSYYYSPTNYKGGELVGDAIKELSGNVDLATIDRLMLVVKDGYQGEPGCFAYQTKIIGGQNNEFNGYVMVTSGYDMGCNVAGRIAHEYGHTFGFAHSESYWCSNPPESWVDARASSYCDSRGPFYSAYYDTMGGDTFNPMYSTVWRNHAGWIKSEQVNVITKSGNYTLRQSSIDSDGIKLLTIPVGFDSDGEPINYYIEFRTADGTYDAAQFKSRGKDNEVIVRLTDISGENGFERDLVDIYRYQPIITLDKPYEDKYRGIRFELTSIEGNADFLNANIEITFPALELSPARVASYVDKTSLEKTMSIKNTSSSNVEVSSIQLGGRNSDAFEISTDSCSGNVLSSNASCDLSVKRVSDLSSFAFVSILTDNENELQVVELESVNIAEEIVYDSDALLEWHSTTPSELTEHDWRGAVDYCNSLTHNNLSDWRLPLIEELRASFQQSDTPLFELPIENGRALISLWSLSEVSSNPLNAYYIYSNDSIGWANGSKDDIQKVVCVRVVN